MDYTIESNNAPNLRLSPPSVAEPSSPLEGARVALPSVRAPASFSPQEQSPRGLLSPAKIAKKVELQPEGRSLKKCVSSPKDASNADIEKKNEEANALVAMALAEIARNSSTPSRKSPVAREAEGQRCSPLPPTPSAEACSKNDGTSEGDTREKEEEPSETYAYKDYAKIAGIPPLGVSSYPSASSSSPSNGPDSDSAALGFPGRLYDLLSHPNHAEGISDVISWQPHGRSWTILKPKEFERTVLPKFYSSKCKYTSFIRQANGWGFRRITQGSDRNSYYHELFLRGLPHLMKLMRRPGVSKKLPSDPENEPDFRKLSKESPLPPLPHQASAKDISSAPLMLHTNEAVVQEQPAQMLTGSSTAGNVPVPNNFAFLGGEQPPGLTDLFRSNQLLQNAVAAPVSSLSNVLNAPESSQKQESLFQEVLQSARANQQITALLQSNLTRARLVPLQHQQQINQASALAGRAGASAQNAATSLAASQAVPTAAEIEAMQRRHRANDVIRRLTGGCVDRSLAMSAGPRVAEPHQEATGASMLASLLQSRSDMTHSENTINRQTAMLAEATSKGATHNAVRAFNEGRLNSGAIVTRRFSENPSLGRPTLGSSNLMMAAAAVAAQEEMAATNLKANKMRFLQGAMASKAELHKHPESADRMTSLQRAHSDADIIKASKSLQMGRVSAGPIANRRFSENPSLSKGSTMSAAAALVAREEEERAVHHRANKVRRLSANSLHRHAIVGMREDNHEESRTALRRHSSGVDRRAAAMVTAALGNHGAGTARSVPAGFAASLGHNARPSAADQVLPSLNGGVVSGDSAEHQRMSTVEQRIQRLHSQLHQAMQEREGAAGLAGSEGATTMVPARAHARTTRRVSFRDSSSSSDTTAAAQVMRNLPRSHQS